MGLLILNSTNNYKYFPWLVICLSTLFRVCSIAFFIYLNIIKYKCHLPSKVIRLLKISTSEVIVKRFILPPDTTQKLDKIYERMIFQDIGHQATKDSDPWDVGNKVKPQNLREFSGHSVKSLTVNNLGFPGHRVSITTVLNSVIVMQKAAINNVLTNGHGCVPVQLIY